MSTAAKKGLPLGPMLVGMVLLAALLFAATGGNILIALAPAVVPLLIYAVLQARIRTLALGWFAIVLFIDSSGEIPFEGRWRSPLWPLSQLFYDNLSNVTGIPVLRFPLVDVMPVVLLLLYGWRRMNKSKIDPPSTPVAMPMLRMLILSLVAIVAWMVWGALRSGNVNESLWQVRGLLLLPILGFLFINTLKGDQSDYRPIVMIVIAAAIWKALFSLYFIYVVVPNLTGLFPEYATTHSDTLIYVWSATFCIANIFEKFDWATMRRWSIPLILTMVGMRKNDRRLAYVSLMACLLMVFLMTPKSKLRRLMTQIAIFSIPFVAAYVSVGWNMPLENRAFGPVHTIKSIIKGDQTQQGADYRDMETFNILATWHQMPVTGVGWGHIFIEPAKLPDISHAMPTYNYHPHNTWMWMWATMGVAGATMLWAWVACLVFLAARAHQLSARRDDRLACLMAIATVISHLNQVYGDMGTRSYNSIYLCGVAIGVVAHIAPRVGAWRSAPAKVALPRQELLIPEAVTVSARQS